jgi:hypothetical protein
MAAPTAKGGAFYINAWWDKKLLLQQGRCERAVTHIKFTCDVFQNYSYGPFSPEQLTT